MLMHEEMSECGEVNAPKQESWMSMFWKRWFKVDEQALEIARLKSKVAGLDRSNDGYFKENQSLQKLLADKAVIIEERDDEIERLKQDLGAKTTRCERLEIALKALHEQALSSWEILKT